MEELRGELARRLASLEQEVHVLRSLTDRAPSIRIDVHVVEIDRAKLPDSILESLGWRRNRSEGDSAGLCDAVAVKPLKGDAAGIIQALGEAKAAKVLASPTGGKLETVLLVRASKVQ